ncbi:MAG TPA: sulfite exporter TauE/SafE family protein [Acidimicrobiia bacterium]|nr:sulfite exporter TauE/SafE family protein [Acidimicrobiia bacterium]
MSWDVVALLVAAGFAAGLVNGVAGGGSLISFPALLAAGHGALVANVTSTVGIWLGYAGGVAGYRHVLGVQRDRVRRLAPTCIAGGLAGAALLLLTPSRFFATMAPYLILGACLLFTAQPRLARVLARRAAAVALEPAGADGGPPGRPARSGPALHVCVFLASVYGSYFGAGLGVILLAVLALLLEDDLQLANGLRGVLALLVNSVGVVVFAVAANVAWSAAGVLAVTSLVGGYAGARLAQRLPVPVFRTAVVLLGLAASARLLVG